MCQSDLQNIGRTAEILWSAIAYIWSVIFPSPWPTFSGIKVWLTKKTPKYLIRMLKIFIGANSQIQSKIWVYYEN